MTSIFTAVLNMSITAGYVALAVIAARILLKGVPKVFSYVLWLPVGIRLVCPFSFRSGFSYLSIFKPNVPTSRGAIEYIPNNLGLMQKPAIDVGPNGVNDAINTLLPAAKPMVSVNPMQIVLAAAGLIWLTGIVLLLAYSIGSYIKVIRNVKTATLLQDGIFECDRISNPFVLGFIKPKIFIPTGLNKNELPYILVHERTHIKRRDYLIKPLGFLLLLIYWFNPLIWLSFALMCKDLEMSCDESVLKQMGSGVKGGYANSLLSLSIKRSGLLIGSPLAFGESSVKSRIKNILAFKRPAFGVIAVSIVVIAALMAAFTANPQSKRLQEPTPDSGYNERMSLAAGTAAGNDKIERYLEIIMSSPGASSNPYDYIKAHPDEYESILKMGEEALNYLLAQFEKGGNNNDLRGQIMMAVCKDLLGARNNVTNEGLLPQDWFSQLRPYQEIQLPNFKGKFSNRIEQLVYDTAIKKYSRPDEEFTVVAPTIFGSYEEDNKLKVFVTVFSSRYRLYHKTLSEEGGSVIPAAITYTTDADGGYTLDEYLEAMDGAYFSKSIKRFCVMPVSKKEIPGLSDKILVDYRDNTKRSELLRKNLINHLKDNNQKGIILKLRTDEMVPLT